MKSLISKYWIFIFFIFNVEGCAFGFWSFTSKKISLLKRILKISSDSQRWVGFPEGGQKCSWGELKIFGWGTDWGIGEGGYIFPLTVFSYISLDSAILKHILRFIDFSCMSIAVLLQNKITKHTTGARGYDFITSLKQFWMILYYIEHLARPI